MAMRWARSSGGVEILDVTREERRRRFRSRMNDRLKQRKLSPSDRASMNRWDDYTEAKEATFYFTDRFIGIRAISPRFSVICAP